MSKPRLSVILRQSFEPGDETHRVLEAVDTIVVHAYLDGTPKKKQGAAAGLFRIEKYLKYFSQRPISIFIPTGCRTDEFLAALHNDFLNWTNVGKILIEVNPLLSNEFVNLHEFVTKLLELRPDNRIGLVSPWKTWNVAQDDELLHSDRVTPYLIIESPQDLEKLPAGSVPVLFALLDEEKARFPEYLARVEGKFGEILFWSPRTLFGVNIQEQLAEDQTPTVILDMPRYEALYPLAKRETMSLNAKIKGTLVVGQKYALSNFRDGNMGVQYAQLAEQEGGYWVVFSQDAVPYFKEIS